MSDKKQNIISKETVEAVAHLARIGLESGELDLLAGQLESILEFIEKLKQVDITQVEPTSHILPIDNVLREDSPEGSLPIDQALKNAPQRDEEFFGVPKVIE